MIHMDKLELIKDKFKNDNFAKNLGVILDDLKEDFVKMHMELRSDMNNFYGRPHGGAIYSLADAAFSVIGNNQNIISVALDCTITYHASPNPGEILYVEGKLLKSTRKISTFIFTLYTLNDGNQNLIATMLSTLYRTGRPINQA
ncbi:MAG: hotdog fold thioesterase [Promethearchaeota archaeon]|nr:MAG: hotdog fold thioesterase [Candidatus Lokiarchaeota archaeon]